MTAKRKPSEGEGVIVEFFDENGHLLKERTSDDALAEAGALDHGVRRPTPVDPNERGAP